MALNMFSILCRNIFFSTPIKDILSKGSAGKKKERISFCFVINVCVSDDPVVPENFSYIFNTLNLLIEKLKTHT